MLRWRGSMPSANLCIEHSVVGLKGALEVLLFAPDDVVGDDRDRWR